MISFRYCTQLYANVKVLQVRLQNSPDLEANAKIVSLLPFQLLLYMIVFKYCSLCYLILCTSRKYPYPPHPPRPTEGTFAEDSNPIEFPFQGVLVIPPTPWNFCYYSTWLGTLCKEYLFQKCCCTLLLSGR